MGTSRDTQNRNKENQRQRGDKPTGGTKGPGGNKSGVIGQGANTGGKDAMDEEIQEARGNPGGWKAGGTGATSDSLAGAGGTLGDHKAGAGGDAAGG